MQAIEVDGEYDSHVHASLFVSAAEEIRHLLHQFAAGILKDSSARIEAELVQCLKAPFPEEQVANVPSELTSGLQVLTAEQGSGTLNLEQTSALAGMEYASSAIDLVAIDVLDERPEEASREPQNEAALSTESIEATVSPTVDPEVELPLVEPDAMPLAGIATVSAMTAASVVAVMAAPATAPTVATLSEAPVLAVRGRQFDQDELDDEIDAVDALDADLFEIF
ncbi:MAG: hypothetical protein HC783_15980 [Rhodobacteraceae bacterium]|nr:hypothetical protein [Paracoccaceae bacterium]